MTGIDGAMTLLTASPIRRDLAAFKGRLSHAGKTTSRSAATGSLPAALMGAGQTRPARNDQTEWVTPIGTTVRFAATANR
jgi:hypothetical protein